jgi:hypothetical protein
MKFMRGGIRRSADWRKRWY